METNPPFPFKQGLVGSYRTYEEWKQVNIVNHQTHSISSYRTYEEWKHVFGPEIHIALTGSYRTYEEWKLAWNYIVERWNAFGSYRTYEEWKLASHTASATVCISSYRTYEEWKRWSYGSQPHPHGFLPYL